MNLGMRNPVVSLQEMFINTFNVSIDEYHVEDVEYLKPWELEKSVNLNSWVNWFHNNSAVSVYISLLYLFVVFYGQKLMKNQKPFVLREALVTWNFLLTVFSILGFIRTVPEIAYILNQENGVYASVCRRDYHNRATAFWGLLFALSKVVELGDTIFSVLRKKPITPLAWIHHSLTMVICFMFYAQQSTSARWYMTMNYFVHSFMYPYFAFRTLSIRLPRFVPMTITCFQLTQMFIGFGVATFTLYAKVMNLPCTVPIFQAYVGPFVYAAFVFMFGNLFYVSYIKKKNIKKE